MNDETKKPVELKLEDFKPSTSMNMRDREGPVHSPEPPVEWVQD